MACSLLNCALMVLLASAGGDPTGTEAKRTLTLDGAKRVLEVAESTADRLGAGGAIAVVDDGGHLIALHRRNGTFASAPEVATGKARTAATFRKPTKAFEEQINGGRTALVAVDVMTPLQGGVPIFVDGQVVGAVGVSGAASAQQDEEIALAAAGALSN